MTLHPSPAARAALFMRQCRSHTQPSRLGLHQSPTRLVSSSHLAPSNFSKQTRPRDTDIESLPSVSNPFLRASPAGLPRRKRVSPSTPSTADPFPPNVHIPPGFFSFVKYRILGLTPPPAAPHKPPPFNVLNNPYRARKSWPPDFSAMHPKQQFHFEKTFRRRMLLKTNSQRYNWNRYVRLVQQSLLVITAVYFVFIADPYAKDGGGTPVDGFRAWFFGQVAKFEHLPEGLREQSEELGAYYGKNWKKNKPFGEREGGDDGASPVNAEKAVEASR